MDDERRELESLLRLVDAQLAALVAPVARRLALALTRAADRNGVVAPRKLDYLRALLDRAIERAFGASPAAQFGDDGKPGTPIARLVGASIRAATEIGIGPLFRDLDRHLAASPDVRRLIAQGRAGATPPPRLDTARTWVDPNGYRLSDRLWQSGQATRDQIDALLEYHLSRGTSAVNIGKELERFLTVEGRYKRVWERQPDGAYRWVRKPITTRTPYGTKGLYAPRRLARTEVTRALGQATMEAARLNPWTRAIGWRLSPAHPEQDICDEWAKQDRHGLGEGNYPPGTALPYPPHPHCLCRLSPVPVPNDEAERIVADMGRWARGEPVPGLEGLDEGIDAATLVGRLTGIAK